jgi:hypothetical protein
MTGSGLNSYKTGKNKSLLRGNYLILKHAERNREKTTMPDT